MGPLQLFVFTALFSSVSASAEVCTNSLLPGAKGKAHLPYLHTENSLICLEDV